MTTPIENTPGTMRLKFLDAGLNDNVRLELAISARRSLSTGTRDGRVGRLLAAIVIAHLAVKCGVPKDRVCKALGVSKKYYRQWVEMSRTYFRLPEDGRPSISVLALPLDSLIPRFEVVARFLNVHRLLHYGELRNRFPWHHIWTTDEELLLRWVDRVETILEMARRVLEDCVNDQPRA